MVSDADPTPRPRLAGLATLVLVWLAAACGDSSTAPGAMGGETMSRDTMPADTMTPDTSSSSGLTDRDILALASYDGSWTWWEFSPDLLDRAGNSPHADQIRTRYNTQAATQLDASGRVRSDADFPDSSAVVKEVYQNGTHVSTLVMYKAVGDPHAGHGSWLWGEYRPSTGEALHSITDDAGICHNCHVTGIDHMRMPDAH